MKTSTLAFVAFLTLAPAVASTSGAADQCTGSGCDLPRTGTAFEIEQQYANGGKFGGVASFKTGTVLDVAQDSMRFLHSFDRIAFWQMPPVLARGE